MTHAKEPLARARCTTTGAPRTLSCAVLALAATALVTVPRTAALAEERIGGFGSDASFRRASTAAPAAADAGDVAAVYGTDQAHEGGAVSNERTRLRMADAVTTRDTMGDLAETAAACPADANLIVRGSFHYAPAGCSDGSLEIATEVQSTCSSTQAERSGGTAAQALPGCADVPLRGARVELYQVGFGDPVGLGSTRTDGTFQLCMINDPGNEVDLQLVVRTCGDNGAPTCNDPGPFPVVVTDASNTIYSASTSIVQNVCAGSVAWDIADRRSGHSGAEAIFDLLANRAGDVLADEVQWPRDARQHVRFPDAPTGFSPANGIVHIAAGDEQDPSRILGSYGISLLQQLYQGTLPPTPSCSGVTWTAETSPGCAWVIGWSDFIAAAILDDPVLRDTPAPGQPPTSTVDLEGPSPPAAGIDVRGAVAASLWDVADEGGEPWDALYAGLPGVWDRVAHDRPFDICQFRRAWRANHGARSPLMPILDRHGIECPFGLDAIDPIHDHVSDLGRPRDLAASGNVVAGFAADGATRIVLRYFAPAPGAVTFQILDDFGDPVDVGALSSLDGDEAVTELAVPTTDVGQEVAFAVLTAPADYARRPYDELTPSRLMSVVATYETGTAIPVVDQQFLDIHRPPVVLLHGWTGNADAWSSWNDGGKLGDFHLRGASEFFVYAHEYGDLSQKPVDEIARQTELAIDHVRHVLHSRGIAATRADVVAHSLGGLLARRYVAGSRYRRPDNFGAGDIHKLITLDTPHRGSPLANLLVSNDGEATLLGQLFDDARIVRGGLGICASCGAVLDMRTDSALTRGLPETVVPSHALVGVGGRELMDRAEGLAEVLDWSSDFIEHIPAQNLVTKFVKRFFDAAVFVYERAEDLQGLLFGETERHDFVVSETSQRGGLAEPNVTEPFGYVPFQAMGLHTTVNHEERVRSRIVELLYAPVSDPSFAPAFPAAPMAPAPLRVPEAARWTEVPDGIAIAQPSPGTHVTVGQQLHVSLQVSPGFVPTKAILVSALGTELDLAAPFEFDVTVRSDVVGSVDLTAFAIDTAGRYARSSAVRIEVSSSATLTDLEARPTALYLFDHSPVRHLTVIGTYDDGSVRDAGSADDGTSYFSDDPDVASVGANGDVTAVGIGETNVHVQNGDVAASVPVVVESTPELTTCRPLPSEDCEPAERAFLKIRDASIDDRDQIRWEFRSRSSVDAAVLGDPTTSRTYSLCIYDERSGVPKLVATLPIHPGPQWHARAAGGLIYRDGAAMQRGLRRVRLTGGAGGTRIMILAKGAGTPVPAPASASHLLLQEARVRVQLSNDETSTCWTTDLTTSARSDSREYRAAIP